MYQEALDISLEENGIEKVKEYYFSVTYHGRQIKHKHYVHDQCERYYLDKEIGNMYLL